MAANRLKQLYESIPKGVKYFFSPIFIRLMVKNKEFQKTFKELQLFEKASEAEKIKIQFKRLKSCLIYAYQNVPYYKKMFDQYGFNPEEIHKFSELKKLPLLEKKTAISAGDELYSNEKALDYYKTYTGGSSGKTMTVLLDQASIYRERACVCYYLSKLGYDPLKTKTVAFWGHNKDADFYYSPLKNEIVISPFRLFQEDQFEGICDDIRKFGATFIMGYPSAIYLFAQLVEKHHVKLAIEHVVYYAENCSEEEKSYIETVIGCKVDSYYGHTERAVFAEIYDSNCMFNDYYGYTELIPTDTVNEYRIVCTGFLSHKMPLIRYATDDVIYKDDTGAYHLVGHKRSEVHLISKNGQKIFKGAMTIHLEELKKLRQYQYVQNEVGKAELHLVVDNALSDDELQVLESYINRRCEGLFDVEIKIVDQLQLTTRGKCDWAITNIQNNLYDNTKL